MSRIKSVAAYTIFDSRGVPTVECELTLTDGAMGRGLVPSGASKGQFEALELRDGDPALYGGRSVFRAVANIADVLGPAVAGMPMSTLGDLAALDGAMSALDGTADKGRLGANAMLAVSMAATYAAARSAGQPVYAWLGEGKGTLLPLPEVQIIGGGAHANWATDLQDFLLIATGATTYSETLAITSNVYHTAGKLLKQRGLISGVADEGGYWPSFGSHREIFAFLVEAIEAAGYEPGGEAAIAVDVAASDLYDEKLGVYRLRLDDRTYTPVGFAEQIASWCGEFPIISIEDPLADVDIAGWQYLRTLLPGGIQVIGDDLFTTHPGRIRDGIAKGLANSVLIKPNQIGTVTETLQAIALTQSAGWIPVISARSGETEDAFIAHLAVGTNAGQLKVGSFTRSERMVKWNEVLRIERQLGAAARFEGAKSFETLATV